MCSRAGRVTARAPRSAMTWRSPARAAARAASRERSRGRRRPSRGRRPPPSSRARRPSATQLKRAPQCHWHLRVLARHRTVLRRGAPARSPPPSRRRTPRLALGDSDAQPRGDGRDEDHADHHVADARRHRPGHGAQRDAAQRARGVSLAPSRTRPASDPSSPPAPARSSATFTPADTARYASADSDAQPRGDGRDEDHADHHVADARAIVQGTRRQRDAAQRARGVSLALAYSPASGPSSPRHPHALRHLHAGGHARYASVTATAQPRVTAATKTTPTITWPTPAAIGPRARRSARRSSTRAASVTGTFAYSPGIGTVLAAARTTLSATFTPADATRYISATTAAAWW